MFHNSVTTFNTLGPPIVPFSLLCLGRVPRKYTKRKKVGTLILTSQLEDLETIQ